MENTKPTLRRGWSRPLTKLGLAFGAIALLAACAPNEGVSTFAAHECKQISSRAEAKINWARVPEVELRVRNGEYSPMVMRLKQGRPYILRIRNRDTEQRVFRARDFFLQNAVLAVGVEGKQADATCIHSVTIPARQTAEIRMVAITDGTYEYEDNLILVPWVLSGGPSGAIIIEERRETAAIN